LNNRSRRFIRDVKNFGPICAAELESMGLVYFDQVEALGFEETCRQWEQYFPERLNANAFLGVACALDGVVWTRATPSHRAAARNLANALRKEFGLAPSKSKRRTP
jgi:hypothetical protein